MLWVFGDGERGCCDVELGWVGMGWVVGVCVYVYVRFLEIDEQMGMGMGIGGMENRDGAEESTFASRIDLIQNI